MSDFVVTCENIHKSFLMGKEAVQALRGVTVNVERGEMICLMGPSGSGKTTLLNIIGGLEEPSRGHVIVDGENIVSLSEDRLSELRLTKMGFIFQNYNLLANFTARENVETPMALAGKSRRERRRKAEKLLEEVGLADRAQHYPSELSGGQQQRVAIARALANDPALIVADEPTGSLDSATTAAVLDVFAALAAAGKTIVLVTHDKDVAKRATRVITLTDGEIVKR